MATNVVIDKLLKQIDRLHRKVNKLRDQCSHTEYTVISVDNDHDGWSQVEITWHENRRCKICDKWFSVETGKEHY